MESQARKWKEFIFSSYSITSETKKALDKHLELKEKRNRKALINVEPFSEIVTNNENYIQVLKKMYEDRNEEKI